MIVQKYAELKIPIFLSIRLSNRGQQIFINIIIVYFINRVMRHRVVYNT